MTPALIPILSVVIPELVKLAESKIGAGKGAEKKQWVHEMLSDFMGILDKRGLVPDWAKVVESPLVEFVDFILEQAVSKLGG